MIQDATEFMLAKEQDPDKMEKFRIIKSSIHVLRALVNDQNDFKLHKKDILRPMKH